MRAVLARVICVTAGMVLLSAPATGLTAGSAGSRAGAAQATALRARVAPAGAVRQVADRQVVPGFPAGVIAPASASLASVSCPAASFCVAVGRYLDPLDQATRNGNPLTDPHRHSLAEEWNGRAWRVMPGLGGSGLIGVSCASTRFCMALGAPAERWNGRTWTAVRTPPNLGLAGISCRSASFCLAVGTHYISYNNPCLTSAVWRGTGWRAVAVPRNSGCAVGDAALVRVSCASASACVAAGTQDGEFHNPAALSLGWNGTKWRTLDTPNPNRTISVLDDVSCPAKSFCMAVGENYCGSTNGDCNMALTWNGTTWQQLNPPTGPEDSGSDLTAVSCASATRCVAISTGTGALAWNGRTWTQAAFAQPGAAGGSVTGIACPAPASCMAAGSYTTLTGAQLTLAEQWNGRTWQPRRTPSPDDGLTGLSGISCRSAASCMAVGTFINGSDIQVTLAERWNGRAWQVLATPDPGRHENVLTAVSCPAARECIAVGYYDTTGGHRALAEQWTGTTWTTLTVPHDGVLTGVSCPAVDGCVAVGSYADGGSTLALSATWNGSTWTIQNSPAPGGPLTEFNAVACPTLTRCIAAGDYTSGRLLPLTAQWNGSTWTTLTTPAPGDAGSLTSISCPRLRNCMAVGRTARTFGLPPFRMLTVAESWNGSRWTVRPTPKLKVNLLAHLDAVSCPAPSRCRAAGGYFASSGNGFVLAEAWNGATWRKLQITDPSAALNDLYAISCPAPYRCIAVGETGTQHTLAYQWNGKNWRQLNTPSP